MTITKIWKIAKSRQGNLSNSLHRSLLYIVNPEKTEGGLLVGGVNCFPDAELAYQQMCEIKRLFGKELGRQGYHVALSCPIGEGDPQTMYQLTEEFLHEFLGDKYEALFAVHKDRGHLHSHIIYNSCNMIDGYKYQYKKGDWKEVIQPITNRLCEKYGWSVLPAEYSEDSQRMSRKEYEYQKFMKDIILADVEYCMAKAEDMEEFLWNMEQLGYQIKKGRHLAVRMDGMSRFRRLDTLDKSLSPEQIETILAAVQGKDVTVKMQTADCGRNKKRWKSDYQKNFYVKMLRLHQIESHRFSSKAARQYREIKRMQELQERYLYLVDHNIKSAEELLIRRNILQETLKEISAVQKQLYADNRRQKANMQHTPVTAAFYEASYQDNMEKLSILKEKKKKLYQELKIVDVITAEALNKSLVHLEFMEQETVDPKRPIIPESPWKRAKREKAEQAEREAQEKKQAYLAWYHDYSHKFMEAVNTSTGTSYVNDYLNMLNDSLSIKEQERSIEFFKNPVVSFSEYAKNRELEKQAQIVEEELEKTRKLCREEAQKKKQKKKEKQTKGEIESEQSGRKQAEANQTAGKLAGNAGRNRGSGNANN